jgi:hypothetical protein
LSFAEDAAKRRKDAYEALHPETKPTSEGGRGRNNATRRQLGDDIANRFTSDTAAKTGQSERAIQRDAERGEKISERTVRDWLSHIDKDSKEARDRRIFDLWMACLTQEEIAAACDCTRDDVRGVKEVGFGENGKIAEFPKNDQAAACHATDFTPPIYNIWEKLPGRNGRAFV